MQCLVSRLYIFQNSLSVYDETFGMEEEEKVEMEKVEEVADDPPVHRRPRFRFNYELFKNLSWIFGLTLILAFVLARWSTKQDEPIVREKVIIIHPEVKNDKDSYDFFHSEELSFLWRFCNRTTYNCSWCPPGWTEHDSRCYHLFNLTDTWQNAQATCVHYTGHLPVVLNRKDQMFLTRMATESRDQNPKIVGIWIGLTDIVKEGEYLWVNGQRLISNRSFWQPGNPNNLIPSYDKIGEGQDCVVIVPPKNYKNITWYNSWDDVMCRGERHFICEIKNFLLRMVNYGSL